MAHSVLVVGATGKQGAAVVKSLLQSEDASLVVHALTRDASTPRAQALAASDPRLRLVQGDQLKPDAIFAQLPEGSISALFLITVPPKEEPQAIPFIDAALAHGVRHIVYSSVDRGGDERSWSNPTHVKHFAEKLTIELHLRDAVKKVTQAGPNNSNKPVTWTILRPVAFMDNYNPGYFVAGAFVSMLSITMKPSTKLQLVATSDIGRWAAKSIEAALADQADGTAVSPYANRAIGLAGDNLTLGEARAIFQRVVGHPTPWALWIVGKLVLLLVPDIKTMFTWFDEEGYGVDIAARQGEAPGVSSFETWLRNESQWKIE
ncbi:hypothetical protein HMPREF1624_05813 [Sporothrix schenckii ATCC 58251]|uniref:NmrA-like domain-containing protein n=1 Tax=Sporothrix schenckii (strain ATCC 58251 / de Perez 2211183) TaxID=1391915 RepID=U7PPX4_SPOS1|nr:hypothetical protein HMPREF1624_05813 [Sporothrix schenckii ATCC 58251]